MSHDITKSGELSPQRRGPSICFCYISWTSNLVIVVMLHFKNIPLLDNETLQHQFFLVILKRLKAGPQKMGRRSTTAFCYKFHRQFMSQTGKDKCQQSQKTLTLQNWHLSPILFVVHHMKPQSCGSSHQKMVGHWFSLVFSSWECFSKFEILKF